MDEESPASDITTFWDEIHDKLQHEYVELTVPRDCTICNKPKFKGHTMPLPDGVEAFICAKCWTRTALDMLDAPVDRGMVDEVIDQQIMLMKGVPNED